MLFQKHMFLFLDPPELSEIISFDDDSCGFQSRIYAENLAPGNYCVILSGFTVGIEGDYELSVSCFAGKVAYISCASGADTC